MSAAAALMIAPALAGGPVHRMPSDYGQAEPAYQLKLVGAPVAGHPLVVALVDANGGQVRGGQVAMVHAVNRGLKASPMIQYVPEALAQDTNGNFVCMGRHHRGEVVAFRGAGPAGKAPVWLNVTISG
jgi:hypothetical protein